MSKALTKTNELNTYLKKRTNSLREWAQNRVDPVALIRFANLEFSQSLQLQKCTPDSIYLALIACAQLGLEPGGVKQEAFIIPYKDTATFQLGYRGIIKLALQSRQVLKLGANVVYEGDVVEMDIGSNAYVKHEPGRDRGEIIGAYAYAKLRNDEVDVEWMSLDDLEKIEKQASRGGRQTPAWRDWADQMYRKAPIRRLGKRLPMSADYALATRLDELAEGRDVAGYKGTIAATGVNVEAELSEAVGVEAMKTEMGVE